MAKSSKKAAESTVGVSESASVEQSNAPPATATPRVVRTEEITPAEWVELEALSKEWVAKAYRTGRTNRKVLANALERLYAAASLDRPLIGVVESPLQLAAAYGLASAWWDVNPNAPNVEDCPLWDFTAPLNDDHIGETVEDKYLVYVRMKAAKYNLPIASVRDNMAGWYAAYQGGNMWAGFMCYVAACRDVLKLGLPEFVTYQPWEDAGVNGGFRVMHKKFCCATDFPRELHLDARGRPHCTTGPSHLWHDGWALWFIDGIQVDEQIVMRPETQTIEQIQAETDEGARTIRIERYGWIKYLTDAKAEVLDTRFNEVSNTQEVLFKLGEDVRLTATCPTGQLPCMGVPPETRTCAEAQAWITRDFNVVART